MENDKVLMVYFDSTRNVMGDLYKNIVNSLSDKKDFVVIVPSAYDIEEFSDDLFMRIKEEVSCENNNFIRVYKLYLLIRKLRGTIRKFKINRCYFQIDQFIYDYSILMLCDGLISTSWIHDVDVHDGEGFNANIKKFLTQYMLFPKINRFIVSYNGAKQEFLLKYGKFYEKNTEIIYLPRLAELEFEDVRSAGYESEYDFIFYGRIEEYKGLDLLLDAMEDASMSNIRLLIVGRGREEEKIRKRIQRQKNVEFINEYVENKKLAELIVSSRFVILPYKSATGTQTVQLANYYGKYVLATKVGCFREYIEEGINGFFIRDYSKDALIQAMRLLYEKNEKRKDLMDNHLSLFNLDVIAEKLQEIIFKHVP